MTEWTKERQAEIREWVRDKSDFTWDAAKDMLDEIERLQKKIEQHWLTWKARENMAGPEYQHLQETLERVRKERDAATKRLELADKLAEALRAMWNASSDEAQLEGGRAVDACLKAWEQARVR